MPLDYRYYRSFYAINQSYRLDDVTAGVDNINQKLRGIQTYEGPFSAFSTYVTTMTDNSASTSVPQNTAVVFTVTLIQQFAQEQTLYITRTGTAVLSFPATITVPANSSTVTFTATWGIDGRPSGSLSAQFFGRLYSSQGPIVAQSRTFTTPGLTCTYSITDTNNNVISSVYEGSNYKIRYAISGLGSASSTGGGAWSVETASSDVTLLTDMSTFSVNGPGTYDVNYLAATDNLLEGSWNYQHYLRLTVNGTTYTLASPTVTLNDSNLGQFSLTVGVVGDVKQNDMVSIGVTAPQNASRSAMFYWKIINVTGINSGDFYNTSGTFNIWSGTTYGNISIPTTITGRTDARQFKVQILNGSINGPVLGETSTLSFDTSFSVTFDFCDNSSGTAPYPTLTTVEEGVDFALRLSFTGIGTYFSGQAALTYSGSGMTLDPSRWDTRPSQINWNGASATYANMKVKDNSVSDGPFTLYISISVPMLLQTAAFTITDPIPISGSSVIWYRGIGGSTPATPKEGDGVDWYYTQTSPAYTGQYYIFKIVNYFPKIWLTDTTNSPGTYPANYLSSKADEQIFNDYIDTIRVWNASINDFDPAISTQAFTEFTGNVSTTNKNNYTNWNDFGQNKFDKSGTSNSIQVPAYDSSGYKQGRIQIYTKRKSLKVSVTGDIPNTEERITITNSTVNGTTSLFRRGEFLIPKPLVNADGSYTGTTPSKLTTMDTNNFWGTTNPAREGSYMHYGTGNPYDYLNTELMIMRKTPITFYIEVYSEGGRFLFRGSKISFTYDLGATS